MTTSATLRDIGVSTVDRNTSDEWKFEVDAIIRRLSLSGQTFTAEDVRTWITNPPHPNAMGARFLAAIRKGWIVKTGYCNATRPDAHARALAQYRGSL